MENIAKLIAEDKPYKMKDMKRVLDEKHEEDFLAAIVEGLRNAVRTTPIEERHDC